MKGLVLAIQPTSRGFGWTLFESPLSCIDWGTMTARPSRGGHILNRLERLLNRYEPSVLVIREFGRSDMHRSPRVCRFAKQIISLAETRGIYVPQYSREAIQSCFKKLGASTRYEMAQFIAQRVDALRHMLPKRCPIWQGESAAMSTFDAAVLAFTFFAYHSGPNTFDE